MEIKLKRKVGALFKLKVHKGDGIPTQETPWFHNQVLDIGLDRMSVGKWIDRCCVGSGNSLPLTTQTQLDSLIAATTTIQESLVSRNTGVEPYYTSRRVTWRFGQGLAAGNISEVGLGWGNTQLWNRALIKDINGNPTTITVLSDEYLDVISEVRVYFETGYAGTINLLDKNAEIKSVHLVTGKPCITNSPHPSASFEQVTMGGVEIYTGALGSITSSPSGKIGTYSANTSYPTPRQALKTINLGLSDANTSHRSFFVSSGVIDRFTMPNGYQFEINPPITKTNAQIMTYTFEMSWDRYEPT